MMHRVLRLVLVFAFFAIFVGAAAAAPVQQQAQYATPVAVVNTSFLNVRTGPGAQYTILITVVGGTTLQVMGISADGSWLQVSTPAGLGWVNVQFTLPRGNFEFVPVVSAPPVVESAPRPEFSGSTGSDDTHHRKPRSTRHGCDRRVLSACARADVEITGVHHYIRP